MTKKISELTPYVGDIPSGTLFEVSVPENDSDDSYQSFSATREQVSVQGGAVVSPIPGTNHNMVAADAGTYMRFENNSAKTLTVQDDATESLPDNSEYHGRNAGVADLVIVPAGSSVAINPPAGGTLVIPQGGTFTLKRVDVDEFDLFGVTVPA